MKRINFLEKVFIMKMHIRMEVHRNITKSQEDCNQILIITTNLITLKEDQSNFKMITTVILQQKENLCHHRLSQMGQFTLDNGFMV